MVPGGVRSTSPDRIDMGPCNLWMTVSGSAVRAARLGDAARSRRISATLWAGSVSPREWRRLRMAAHWHMQRATVSVQGTV